MKARVFSSNAEFDIAGHNWIHNVIKTRTMTHYDERIFPRGALTAYWGLNSTPTSKWNRICNPFLVMLKKKGRFLYRSSKYLTHPAMFNLYMSKFCPKKPSNGAIYGLERPILHLSIFSLNGPQRHCGGGGNIFHPTTTFTWMNRRKPLAISTETAQTFLRSTCSKLHAILHTLPSSSIG